jgi:hypothetical protein
MSKILSIFPPGVSSTVLVAFINLSWIISVGT